MKNVVGVGRNFRSQWSGILFLSCVLVFASALRAEISSWSNVSPAGGSINHDSNQSIWPGALVELPEAPGSPARMYSLWREKNATNGSWQLHVSVYSGDDLLPSWKRVDTSVNGSSRAPNLGINFDVQRDVRDVVAVAHNSELYVGWIESVGKSPGRTSNWCARVARYNGDDSKPDWKFVDGGGAGGINLSATNESGNISLASFGGALFASWQEYGGSRKSASDKVRVRSFNSTTGVWSWEDGGSNGLNIIPGNNAGHPVLVATDTKLYVGFNQYNGTGTDIRVKVYQGGSNWNLADGGGVYSVNPLTVLHSGVSVGAGVCLGWGTVDPYGVQVSCYDGSNWVDLAGGDSLNFDPSNSSYQPQLALHNSKLYISWSECEAGPCQARVRSYDFGSSTFDWADGGAPASNVNADPLVSVDGKAKLLSFSGKLYVFVGEGSPVRLGHILVGE